MTAKVSELIAEIIARCKTLPEFGDRGYSVYDMDDLETTAFNGFPLVAVTYEGREPVDNSVNGVARGSCSATVLALRFMVVVGVEYQSISNEDTKPTATDLLDAIIPVMLGYKGVNNRPWKLVGETPVDGALEGVIFYGQIWETEIIISGSFVQN